MSYTGFQSGGRHGPSRAVKDIASRTKSIGNIFLFLFPIALFERIMKMTHCYTYEEPVKKEDAQYVEKQCVKIAGQSMWQTVTVRDNIQISRFYLTLKNLYCSF